MSAVTYQLELQGPGGMSKSGKLTISMVEGKADISQLSASKSQEWTVGVIQVQGSLIAPEITGADAVPLLGIGVISLMGPPIAYMLSGPAAKGGVGLQFNLIDSPGRYIGGGLNFTPEGGSGEFYPFGFLGSQT